MENILKSASKLVLLAMAFVLAASFLYVVITNQVEGTVVADIFKVSIGAIFGFYFAHKGDSNSQFLGK